MKELQDILKAYAKQQGPSVLGTVVDVRGSAYRRPGARILLQNNGDHTGMISGGCLDKDVMRRAWDWTENGPQTVLYDTHGDALHPQGRYGSGCDGMVHLFLERIPAPLDPLQTLQHAWASDRDVVMATIYEADGAFAQCLGQRLFQVASGQPEASPGLPEHLQQALGTYLESAWTWSKPRSIAVCTDTGRATALVEPLPTPARLLVFGAGDDAQPLVALASLMGWSVHVADPSEMLATSKRFPGAEHVFSGPVASLLDRISIGPRTFVVMMTHSFDTDCALLPALFASAAPYIGLMGPRPRTKNIMRTLLAAQQLPDPNELERLQTPVGLDLGSDAPEEVALSILAAIVAFRSGRKGGLLKERAESIHDTHERHTTQLHKDTL